MSLLAGLLGLDKNAKSGRTVPTEGRIIVAIPSQKMEPVYGSVMSALRAMEREQKMARTPPLPPLLYLEKNQTALLFLPFSDCDETHNAARARFEAEREYDAWANGESYALLPTDELRFNVILESVEPNLELIAKRRREKDAARQRELIKEATQKRMTVHNG